MLPLHPTGYADSPYAAHSAFAGNPCFIPIREDLLSKEGRDAARTLAAIPEDRVRYEGLLPLRKKMLLSLPEPPESDMEAFRYREREWLWDYTLYTAIKEEEGGKPFFRWRDPLWRGHDMRTLIAYAKENRTRIHQIEKEQYYFNRYFEDLCHYAQEQGVLLIGDMPLYVALDSADVWAHRENFLLREDGMPTLVAGVPPDEFSPLGQMWGNPIYNWEKMRQDRFSWWRMRLGKMRAFDGVRLDHFIGFCRYYTISAEEKNAKNGRFLPGPGAEILEALSEEGVPLIAEDLGCKTPEVDMVKDAYGIPGMVILQFAFNGGADNEFLPHAHQKNSAVYGGTHDNETLFGYFSGDTRNCKRAAEYFGCANTPKAVSYACLRAGLASVADIAIFTMADWLSLGNEGRINTPGRLENNWVWRLPVNACTESLASHMKTESQRYAR